MKRCISGLLLFFLLALFPLFVRGAEALKFSYPASLHLPVNKIQCLYQDRKGFLWLGTTMGLYRYDGYETQAYKNDLFNNVHCICEDNSNRLWFGTRGAVKVLHLDTGEIETYRLDKNSNLDILSLCMTSRNEVLIGTGTGIYRYDPATRHFIHTVIPLGKDSSHQPSVQTILEDRNGHIWFGTWSDGLWRWDLKTNRMVRYPRLNEQNSVHYLFQDSKGTLWATGWRSGLYRLHFSKDLKQMSYESFRKQNGDAFSLADNLAYCIAEDRNTGTILVGTREGLSITSREQPGRFTNYHPESKTTPLAYGEVDAIVCDKENGIWLGSMGGGLLYNNSRRLPCRMLDIRNDIHNYSTLSAVSVLAEDNGDVWVGMENSPLYIYKSHTGQTVNYQSLPEFKGLNLPTVSSIVRSKSDGSIYLAYNGGVARYRKGQPVTVWNLQNAPFLLDYHVNSVYVDNVGNLFVASWAGVGIRFADGQASAITTLRMTDGTILSDFEVRSVLYDRYGTLWLLTSHGLLKIKGNLRKPSTLVAEPYVIPDERLSIPNPCCLYEDRKGNLWVGSDAGLSRYDRASDTFRSMTDVFHLPGNVVYSIIEDYRGDFWLGTNEGLVHLMKKNGSIVPRIYTKEDGLSDDFFNMQAVSGTGRLLFFGNSHGVVCIDASQLVSYSNYSNITLTGLNVNGRSVELLPPDKKAEIISESPEFCKEITIPASYDDFTLFFSALSYRNINQVRYAYKLDGLDSRWQYTDSYSHNAHYSQLPSGTYKFRLKAMNDDGTWGAVKTIQLHILPPFYATWWAYTIYVVLLLVIGYRCFLYYSKKQTLQHTLNMHTMAVYNENAQPLEAAPVPATPQHLEIPEPNMEDVKVKSANEEFLDKAVSVVKEHLKDEDYSVDRFVLDMSMSKSAVYKRMKSLTGMNTSSFIKSIRLKAAIQLMKQNCEVRVSDLAYLVGFSDPKYFSACFKKEYGMTPSEYVERFLKK